MMIIMFLGCSLLPSSLPSLSPAPLGPDPPPPPPPTTYDLPLQSGKESKQEREKIRKAIASNNLSEARIFGEMCKMKESAQTNYTRLAAQLDCVACNLEAQAKMNMVNKNMMQTVKTLRSALKATPLEGVQNNMTQFDKLFEDLNVQTGAITGAMQKQVNLATPQEEVDELLRQVADEHNLEVNMGLPSANRLPNRGETAGVEAEDSLEARVSALRAP